MTIIAAVKNVVRGRYNYGVECLAVFSKPPSRRVIGEANEVAGAGSVRSSAGT